MGVTPSPSPEIILYTCSSADQSWHTHPCHRTRCLVWQLQTQFSQTLVQLQTQFSQILLQFLCDSCKTDHRHWLKYYISYKSKLYILWGVHQTYHFAFCSLFYGQHSHVSWIPNSRKPIPAIYLLLLVPKSWISQFFKVISAWFWPCAFLYNKKGSCNWNSRFLLMGSIRSWSPSLFRIMNPLIGAADLMRK